MPVNSSPRLRDSLEYEEPEATDARFTFGFRSLTLDSAEYEQYEPQDNDRPFVGNLDPSATRRKRRQRQNDLALSYAVPFQYRTVADGDAFRLAVVLPGTESAPVECQLIWESSKSPKRDYVCLSYSWGTTIQDAAILCDGYRFPVTKNLLRALQSLRSPTTNLLIWIDQICINQSDVQERSHQVSIMINIFSRAKEVYVWLGIEGGQSKKLCEYAKKMKRGEDSPKSTWTRKTALNRIMTQKQLEDAIQSLLQRPWFQRVWVIPEVALARFSTVACGSSRISWDNLVRLIRDTRLPQANGFEQQTHLLGNPRQRIAILTQMIASQRKGLLHTDITQLMILAKSSKATDSHDKVYAFYGMTLLTTVPDYTRSEERLFVDIAQHYVNSIRYDDYYSKFHGLSEQRRSQQLMSMIYSAGKLHQHDHYHLPSWVADWTFPWYQAPIWCKTESNIVTGTVRDEWSAGIRCDYRAGGDKLETFEVVDGVHGAHQLRLSALLFDTITEVSETTLAPTPAAETTSPLSPAPLPATMDSPTFTYGRDFFRTLRGTLGMATQGIRAGDVLAILLGGDVPVVLRQVDIRDQASRVYELLCECFVQSAVVMNGDLNRTDSTLAKDIILD